MPPRREKAWKSFAIKLDGLHVAAFLDELASHDPGTEKKIEESILQIRDGAIDVVPSPLRIGRNLYYAFPLDYQITVSVDYANRRIVVLDIRKAFSDDL